MMGFIVFICFIILIVLFVIKSSISDNFRILREKIDSLERELQRIRSGVPQVVEEKKIQSSRPPVVKPVFPLEPEIKLEVTPEVKPESKPEVILSTEKIKTFEHAEVIEPVEQRKKVQPIRYEKSKKPGFFERNPDLEKFIGENLINKVGIGMLVIGIGYFVKYAIDQDWIHEIGRVLIGILCGGALLGLAHYLRKKFAAFSSVLVGGGIAVLYLTITIGFQEYQIFSQTAAFIIMIGITAFTIALSLGYDRMELAVLAILGGFGSPFMVSTGEGNYIVLFTYILTLNVGMLVLAYYKKWSLVNIVSYAFTILLYGSWLAAKFDGENLRMLNWSLFFGTSFYLTFFGMNIVNNLKERMPFKALDFSILLSNTFLYYAAGMYMLSFDYGFIYRGLFTISLAVFNFIFAFTLYKNQKVDKNLVFLLIGLVLTFLSLAAPVQLEGNYITLFWAAEGVLLLWLSQKSGIQLMRLASVLVNVLMVFSLFMDWYNMYLLDSSANYDIILNKAYVTGFVSFMSLMITNYLLRSESEKDFVLLQGYKAVIVIATIAVCYGFNVLELQYQMRAFEVEDTAFKIVTGTYNMAFILGLILVSRFISMHPDVRSAFAVWGAVAIFMYLLNYHQPILEARDLYLVTGEMTTGFFFHYLLVLLLITICVSSIAIIRKLTEFNKNSRNIYSWILIAFFVFIASHELDHLITLFVYQDGDSLSHILNQNHKIGWPILWGVSSFLLISIGLKQKIRHLRIISLVLFLITLLKLFLVDLKGISDGGKIAAFISLSILLLVISFMYQRLKKLLLTDDAPAQNETESKS